MAYELTNTLRSASIIRVVGAGTTTIQLANLAVDANETVTSASIKRLNWSTNGNIQITRNSVPLLSLHGSGQLFTDDFSHSIANNSTSPIVITVTSGGSAIIEVTKQAHYTIPLEGM